jgi:hypothetical protein
MEDLQDEAYPIKRANEWNKCRHEMMEEKVPK